MRLFTRPDMCGRSPQRGCRSNGTVTLVHRIEVAVPTHFADAVEYILSLGPNHEKNVC